MTLGVTAVLVIQNMTGFFTLNDFNLTQITNGTDIVVESIEENTTLNETDDTPNTADCKSNKPWYCCKR